MKEKISQDVIDAINRIAPETLEAHGVIAKARHGYICPFCGNGSGKDGTGISPLVVDSHVGWKCHKCGESFNNMELFARHYNLDKRADFQQLVESICADFRIDVTRDVPSKTTEKKSEVPPAVLNAINADLHADIQPLKAFVAAQGGLWRGLPLEILERFGCRFISNWTPPKSRAAQKYATPTPRMIIPANADGLHSNYLARLTVPKNSFDRTAQKYIAEKQHAGVKTLFNPDALTAKSPVFVVEGYIDCMTIDYAGFKAVAVGGADGYQLLVDAVAALEEKPRVIILFDPDDTGRKLAPKLQSALRKVDCAAVTRFLSDDVCKLDVNQLLQENGVDFLIQKLSTIQQDASQIFDKRIADKLQSARFQNTATDAEPIGISDCTSGSAPRQERADSMNELLTTREVADFLGVTVSTVKNWRQRKLFGCYFFAADEKHGDTLYYKRERVEQLKAIYQRGILQNMYKLARKNPEPTPPDYFQKSDSSDEQTFGEEISFRHREFLIVDEVADYFGVTVRAVQQWVERGQLKEDMLGHNGDLYFAIDNVLEFTPPKSKNQQAAADNQNIPDDMKHDLDDAIIWLKSLTPESFTVADARDKCRSVALAAVFGFHNDVENFFDTLKAAKKLAKERLKEDEAAELTQKLPDTVRRALSALAEGVSVDFIRRAVDREITAVSRQHDEYSRQEKIQERKRQAEERRKQREAKIVETVKHIAELREMPATPERDAEIIAAIRDSCEWEYDKQGLRKCVKATADNINKIFTDDPNIAGLIGFDDFLQADVFLKSPIWDPQKKRGTEWGDRDDSQLRFYLRQNYKELSSKDLINDAVTVYSGANRFHELKDYFKSLPQWDGVKRAETLYIDWLKVVDTKYAREVTIKHLLAAVARIFNPGCKFYWALVLRGNQKIGKSYVFQRLGGKWYKAISDRVDDPHVIDTLRLVWIGEFKEMSGMRKTDVNAIKDFIERDADVRRLAYARRAGTHLRHCVFGITVNDDEFFTDATGNRRFLVLDSPLPKFGYVKEVRGEKLSDDNVIAQIWAEVYHLYNQLFKDGFDDRKLELSAETELEGERIAETYLRDDGLANEILGYLDTKIPPLIIWQLLSREERRKFFVDGGKIQIEQGDLQARFKNRVGKKYDELSAEFETACKVRDGFLRHFTDKDNRWQLVFYGAVERQHICAAEVFNECFGADNRKRMARINEVLAHLDGWHLGERIRNADPAYPDQKKAHYRG